MYVLDNGFSRPWLLLPAHASGKRVNAGQIKGINTAIPLVVEVAERFPSKGIPDEATDLIEERIIGNTCVV